MDHVQKPPSIGYTVRHIALLFLAFVGTVPVGAGAEGAGPGRDLSGVWVAIAAEPPGGLMPAMPPLTPAGEAMVKAFEDYYGSDAPEAGGYCVPIGMPGTMFSLAAYPIEIIMQSDRITMLAEYDMQIRRIYMDGRGHPDDYPLTRMGHSIGRWEGDTLIIDTALLQKWEIRSWPRSDKSRITEKIHLMRRADVKKLPPSFASVIEPLDDILMVVETTVIDPDIYAETPRVTMYYQRISDKLTLEYDCPVDLWLQALEAHRAGMQE